MPAMRKSLALLKIRMRIRFLEDISFAYHYNICCFSGHFDTEFKGVRRGHEMEVTEVKRGKKKKGGRDLEISVDQGTMHPDWFQVPEKFVEIL